MKTVEERVQEVLKYGAEAIGKQQFIDLCYGDVLQASEMIRAYCYDCMGFFADGIDDCKNPVCPLYSKMPYSNVLYQVSAPCRGKNIGRNPQYPVELRLRTARSKLGIDANTINKGVAASIVDRKLKPRKYPQEITQKKITMRERETAMFDTAIKKYENDTLVTAPVQSIEKK